MCRVCAHVDMYVCLCDLWYSHDMRTYVHVYDGYMCVLVYVFACVMCATRLCEVGFTQAT